MEWLSQNWIWVVLVVGVIWLLARTRHGAYTGGHGTHGMAHEGPAGQAKEGKADQPAGRTAPSHRHGRGGCC